MKFSIIAEKFTEAIKPAVSIASRRAVIPALEAILIEVTEKNLAIKATNLEEYFVANLSDIDSSATFRVGVNVGHLYDIVKLLNETIEIGLNNNRLEIATRTGKYALNTFDPDHFPEFPTIKEATNLITFEGALFKSLVDDVGFAASNDEIRPELKGLYFASKGSVLTVAASDGYRAVIKRMASPTDIDTEVLIPVKFLQKVKSYVSDTVNLLFTPAYVSIEISVSPNLTYNFYSRLIDEKYPNIDAVVPTDFISELEVDRQTFLKTLKRLENVVNRQTGRIIIYTPDKNTLTIESRDEVEAVESIPIKLTGETFKIAFNIKFIINSLSRIESDVVVIKVKHPHKPVLLTPKSGDDLRHIIMPQKVEE